MPVVILVFKDREPSTFTYYMENTPFDLGTEKYTKEAQELLCVAAADSLVRERREVVGEDGGDTDCVDELMYDIENYLQETIVTDGKYVWGIEAQMELLVALDVAFPYPKGGGA